jgi:hypothetical protein
MSDITVNTTSQPITATVSGGTVSASVTSSSSSVTIAGGVGPQGPQGIAGTPAALNQVPGVTITNVQAGDVLRYDGTWKNYHDVDIVDGGNW